MHLAFEFSSSVSVARRPILNGLRPGSGRSVRRRTRRAHSTRWPSVRMVACDVGLVSSGGAYGALELAEEVDEISR